MFDGTLSVLAHIKKYFCFFVFTETRVNPPLLYDIGAGYEANDQSNVSNFFWQMSDLSAEDKKSLDKDSSFLSDGIPETRATEELSKTSLETQDLFEIDINETEKNIASAAQVMGSGPKPSKANVAAAVALGIITVVLLALVVAVIVRQSVRRYHLREESHETTPAVTLSHISGLDVDWQDLHSINTDNGSR